MGRVGKMEELQNLAVFLISGGCDWINGETIAMDGGQALAMGGNLYQLRDWSDADWNQAREIRSRRKTKRTEPRGANTAGANMDLKFSQVKRKGPITTVTLSRPEVYNALHIEAHFELNKVFDDFAADPEQWVAIVTGAGDKAFCAGNDLKWQAAGGKRGMGQGRLCRPHQPV